MSPRTVTIGGTVLEMFESCAYRWLFDTERHRFRRVPRTARLDDVWSGEWQHYDHLDLDDARDSFVVSLNEAGTRLMGADGHLEGCACDLRS